MAHPSRDHPKERYDPPGFKLSLTLKDLRLALAAAEEAGVHMPLADVVHESLLDAVAHGDGDRDLAALALVAMRRAAPEETSTPAQVAEDARAAGTS